MTKRILATFLLLVTGAATRSSATLPAGANVLPSEVHSVDDGKEYCQMCAYAERPATIAEYGNLHDEAFWSDLEKLQALHKAHANFGFFGQIIDSTDSAAIRAAAKKHGITFPVVYTVDPDFEKVYQVGNVSRTIYYSSQFKIGWSGVGLDDKSSMEIEGRIKSDPQG